MIALLERAGVTRSAARDARNVLIVYTIGFAGFAARPPFDQGERPLPPAKAGANFESGLRWLLAGIAVKARGRARRVPA
jgi:TetR/AcrR family transcriptional regulator, tetracycline repressor protein